MLLEILSRAQFAFTITFHILFPAFSIGLVTFIAIMEAIWLKTGNEHYRNICKFWTKVLALTFGMGIVSGIVMEFQLGTNWSKFTAMVGNVLGVLFTYEVLTAFFIEAGFLGVMFFGWNRVSPRFHFLSTVLALFGVTLSAFWIMSANSWMQTPGGVSFHDGKFAVESWLYVIFNPSFLVRYFHMMLATYIASFLVIAAISAYYLLKNRYTHFAKTCLSFVMWAILILTPIQVVVGDMVGLMVLKYQPMKTAAMEGLWETERGAPLILFGWPDQKAEKNYFEISIPKLSSLINTHSLDGEMKGLKSVSPEDRPNVAVVFWCFRIMVGLGLLIFLGAVVALILRMKKTLYNNRWFLRYCLLVAPVGFICIITGWFTAEFGRQPWVVYNYLRTIQAHSPVTVHQVLTSFIAIIAVYGVIFGYFYFRYFFSIIAKGPLAPASQLDQSFYYMSPGLAEKEADPSLNKKKE
jgi:cytochrome d ubiquinol oxidase subunit I